MDAYQFAQQNGQVIGGPRDGIGDDDYAAEDLMDLLLYAYAAAGARGWESREGLEAAARFSAFCNDYLGRRRVTSTGVVDGSFALVFDDGTAVPLSSAGAVGAGRPDVAVPITTPRDSRLRGMPVADSSVPITTGKVGSPRGRR